jgi:hypothetical protein
MEAQTKHSDTTVTGKKKTIIGIVILLVVLITIFILFQSVAPERSVASYCKTYKEQNAKLANTKGSSYSVSVFTHSSSDPGDFASAFSALEKVAPDDIRPDVTTLQKVFQKIKDDPTQGLGASLSGLSAESSVTNWTSGHCGS